MKKTLLISTSLSSKSINYELLKLIHQFFPNEDEAKLVSIRDFELPIYNEDIEKETGIRENAMKFMQLIKRSDKLIFGIAEHNGSVTAAFKNILDWLSRINEDYRFLSQKEILLVGTSPSPHGAKNALNHAQFLMQALGGEVKGLIPFPSYYTTFSNADSGLVLNNEALKAELIIALNSFLSADPIRHLQMS